MAEKYPAANGNWSSAANWNGGTKPVAGDLVYANGKTVTIDEDPASGIALLATTAGGTAGVGGVFTLSTERTIVVTNITAGTTACVTCTNGAGVLANFTVSGLISGGSSVGAIGVAFTGLGNLIINGNSVGGSASTTHGIYHNSASGILTQTGLAYGGTTLSQGAYNANTGTYNLIGNQTVKGIATNIINNLSGTMNINGNIYGSTQAGTPTNAVGVQNLSTGILNITGSVIIYDTLVSSVLGIVNNAGAGKLTVSANAQGGTAINCIAISNSTIGELVVTGNLIAGSATNTPGVYSSSGSVNDIAGSITANAGAALISTALTARNKIRGSIVNVGKVCALYVTSMEVDNSLAINFTVQNISSANRVLTTDNTFGMPATSDVRYQQQYGAAGQYTGTLVVPSVGDVLQGVLVDAYHGTYLPSSPADFIAELKADDLGKRLEVCATIQTTGDQLAALS